MGRDYVALLRHDFSGTVELIKTRSATRFVLVRAYEELITFQDLTPVEHLPLSEQLALRERVRHLWQVTETEDNLQELCQINHLLHYLSNH